MSQLTHFDQAGSARMVDISEKAVTHRVAIAQGTITASPQVIAAIKAGTAAKGDVLGVARIAGIMGAKRTADLIPLCHNLPMTRCGIDFQISKTTVTAICTAETDGKTGVEMEALTGAACALLTIYDMCKALDKEMVLGDIHLVRKSGGKSGDFYFGGGK